MSRIGDFLRGYGGSAQRRDLGYDLGPSEPIPGRHVVPEMDQARTERMVPFSATGTINWDGYLVPSDYNPDLTRFAALDVYERMRRSDPAVRETLWHMKGPIVNADWQIDPPEDASEEEREQAEFARAALFEWLEQPWTEVIEHALTHLDFGHSVFETVFQIVERELAVRTPLTNTDPAAALATEDESGEHATGLPSATKNVVTVPIPLPPDSDMKVLPARKFTTWRKFSPRLPRTIWKWNHDEFGELTSITQTVYVNLPDGSQGFRVVDTPASNLMVFTHEKWGDEFTGIALLRSAYKPWVMKEMLEKISSIAYERHGVGYLVGYMPRDLANDQSAQDTFLATLQNMRQDAVAVFPGPKQEGQAGNQSYLVEILTPPGGIPDFEPMLNYYRGEIAGAMLARFKELGHSASGSRATADVQSAVWYNALHAVARYLEAQFNVAIRRLIDLNYTGVSRYPKLKASGIEARNLLEFSQSIALLVDSKMLTPDSKTRGWVRAMIDAPTEDADEARAMALYDKQMAEAGLAAASAGTGEQSPTDKLKATGKSRGVETDGGENPSRPRVENAK